MNAEIRIRSVHDGTALVLSNFISERPSIDSQSFLVSVVSHSMRAEARVCYFMAPDLGAYFQRLAQQWRGWKGEIGWSSLEQEFELGATTDSTGHVALRYFLRPSHTGFHWELRGSLELEAGQLEALAQEVSSVWSAYAT